MERITLRLWTKTSNLLGTIYDVDEVRHKDNHIRAYRNGNTVASINLEPGISAEVEYEKRTDFKHSETPAEETRVAIAKEF